MCIALADQHGVLCSREADKLIVTNFSIFFFILNALLKICICKTSPTHYITVQSLRILTQFNVKHISQNLMQSKLPGNCTMGHVVNVLAHSHAFTTQERKESSENEIQSHRKKRSFANAEY